MMSSLRLIYLYMFSRRLIRSLSSVYFMELFMFLSFNDCIRLSKEAWRSPGTQSLTSSNILLMKNVNSFSFFLQYASFYLSKYSFADVFPQRSVQFFRRSVCSSLSTSYLRFSFITSASLIDNLAVYSLRFFSRSVFFVKESKDFFTIYRLIYACYFSFIIVFFSISSFLILSLIYSFSLKYLKKRLSCTFKHFSYLPRSSITYLDSLFQIYCFSLSSLRLSMFCNCSAATSYFALAILNPASSVISLRSIGIFEL